MSLTVNEITQVANQAADSVVYRRMEFAGVNINTKHNRMYAEFGWLENPQFTDFLNLYERNPVANAIITKLNKGTFQTMPKVIEGEEEEGNEERSPNEVAADKFLKKWWSKIKDGDRRNMVGDYAALVFMVRDGSEDYSQPITSTLNEASIERVIPVWQDQLVPTAWNTDAKDFRYGDVTMYEFRGWSANNKNNANPKPTESFPVHPDRVLIINEGVEDYSLESGYPLLQPALNSLTDIQKITGSCAEGLYKNAARQLAVDFDKDTDLTDIMRAYGINPGDSNSAKLFREKFNERMTQLNTGADSAMIGKGMKTSILSVTAADPTPNATINEKHACAVAGLPYRVVMGNETGERSSTEDNKQANSTYMERQLNHGNVILSGVMEWAMNTGVLPRFEYSFEWPDLNEAGTKDKIDNLGKLTTAIKQSVEAYGEPIISENEAREIGGFAALDEFDDDERNAREDA